MRRIAGMMSGTSADGIDVAVVEVVGRGLSMTARLMGHHSHPYLPRLRQQIFEMRGGGATNLQRLVELEHEVTLAYATAFAEAIAALHTSAGDVEAIAAHGQTLYHRPPCTLQCLDAALLAGETRRRVVSDFRRADCAAGGQGAPLVPFADYLLFRHQTRSRVLLNIGGIANLTHLPAAGTIDQIVAFDTGPGNCISDYLCRELRDAAFAFDAGGSRALRGNACEAIITTFLDGPYVKRSSPKSTDGPEMILAFLQASGERLAQLSIEDRLATAVAVTVETIASAIASLPDATVDDLIVSGGGTENAAIMRQLARRVREIGVTKLLLVDEMGVPSQAKEAMAFALLGAATLDNEPGNVPSATGASRRVVLGSITPAP